MPQSTSRSNRRYSAGLSRLNYRLALDLGPTSIGWAMLRLGADGAPCAVIRAGVRIFSDGRNPKDKTSLAVARRLARSMRRRRDRLLRRKARMMRLLIEHGFFPGDEAARKRLELLNPYELRARGLDAALSGPEFARALFHINQRRGFRSNRRTDKASADTGPLKAAISQLASALDPSAADGKPRTVGELLHRRMKDGETVRARLRERKEPRGDGKTRTVKTYDLYVDRSMVAAEFDALWSRQSALAPSLYTESARAALRDCLLYQRPLRPVMPGRCTLLPDLPRAPLALPSMQRFRIYQEVNNLRVEDASGRQVPLTISQRDVVVAELERHGRRTFDALRKLLKLPSTTTFNLEDAKRTELKGNATSALLGKADLIGHRWHQLSWEQQDALVLKLLEEESEEALHRWLTTDVQVDADAATAVMDARLPDGYGRLSAEALARILPQLQADVCSYADAAMRAGFNHSDLTANEAIPGRTFPLEGVNTGTGEVRVWHVHQDLPYYGEVLTRHVAFGSGVPSDVPERRYGRIANPTVHIGLNQVRVVVNALLARYGHPREVVLEVARDLAQSREERAETLKRQAENQRRNERLRAEAATILGAPDRVRKADLEKLILWEELAPNPLDRCCPYSGEPISIAMLLSDEVEVEHIFPFSRTLDDSLNNKTVARRAANRVKGNRTPWEARADFEAQGWAYTDMLARASRMPRAKRNRFAEDGLAAWLRDHKDFLARALNDTRYLSRVAREYVSLICPQGTTVIPGRLTALLRAKFGLNEVLGVSGAKNREDHRHHAVDACVIGVTDRGMLQRVSRASQSAEEQHLAKLVDSMPLPWPTYREHVTRAVEAIVVSHKPDHGHEGAMHNDTAYGLLADGRVRTTKTVDGRKTVVQETLKVIPFSEAGQELRHGRLPDGTARPYKGYKGDSNYCLEIVSGPDGKWLGRVVSTFDAYQIARLKGASALRDAKRSSTGEALVMRLMAGDYVRLHSDETDRLMRIATLNSAGTMSLCELHEANVDARNRDPENGFRYTYKTAGSLQKAGGHRVTVSPAGDVTAHKRPAL